MDSGLKFQDAQKPALGTPALEISTPPRKSVFPIFSNFSKLAPEAEFLDLRFLYGFLKPWGMGFYQVSSFLLYRGEKCKRLRE
jgi:hypothetical protein